MNDESSEAPEAYTPPLPRRVRVNPIVSGAEWRRQREACARDAGVFHGRIAARTIHWYHSDEHAWLSRDEDGRWRGWSAADGAPVELAEWTPWRRALDESEAPFYRWFAGGLTNAAFNEVDRHVLAGHGAETAYHFEGDRWDPAANGGRGGPVHARRMSRRELLIQSVLAARALADLGLGRGDRIAFNLPNILEQIVWTEAAKRLAVIYTPVFGGFSDKTLADRIEDAGARVVVTADGASRNAETVPFKEAYTDPALERYLPASRARAIVVETLAELCSGELAGAVGGVLDEALADEITVEPADVMRVVARALQQAEPDGARLAELRADLAEALAAAPARVERVVVIRHAGLAELAWREGRDLWAHDLLQQAAEAVCRAAGVAGLEALDALADEELVAALWRAVPPQPVEADFPLFVIYTSGSTGKPKGVVHVHGGYVAGLAHTMAISFDVVAGEDVIYVVADPGWITGQSYLITASLAARVTGVVAEGAPVFPHAGRFASIIERYGATVFKAGVTFLKTVMADPQNRADVERYDLSGLKVATFCAEPTSPAVQAFGMELMTPQYINSYWATEHGGIVWTHPYGNPDQRLRADARTYPLPWVFGDVWLGGGASDAEGRVPARRAADGEKGEIVITRPYPYLARTIWGDAGRVGEPGWKGDVERFARTYFGRFRDGEGRPLRAYVQGDFARRYADGGFSLHGRSDDVINVSGHRLGTEEIEGAVLKDKQLNPDSPVGNCIVVGAPHRDKGLTPVAFVLPAPGRSLTGDDERRLKELVRQEKGAVAVPTDFIVLPAFPETRSGKYMRRFLKSLMLEESLGDTTTLRNPECLAEAERAIAAWKRGRLRAETQRLVETTRFLRIQYDAVGRDGAGEEVRVATLTIDNPPVNALSERLLDELDTALAHLERRRDVRAVVLAGAGRRSFVAGADVRQLLEEVPDEDAARSLPAKAHTAFDRLERLQTPTVAAVDGLALGGGCELALACHARVGGRLARLGQPEINLFLPPGFGSTQRLPRLLAERANDAELGVRRALAMLLSGRRADAGHARGIGLLDALATGADDALSLARAHAREAALTGAGPLAEAARARRDAVERWRAPAAFPEAALANPYVALCRRQADAVGRAAAAEAIVALVRRGFEEGYAAGLAAERAAFARLLLDAERGGRKGLRLFLEKRSPPLPARPRPPGSAEERRRLEAEGRLLPLGAAFVPGVTPLPDLQLAQAVVRDAKTGAPAHGDPTDAEVEALVPVPEPGPNEALVYVLASEVNYNDVWAITGIPVSPFDEHDEDVHVTGSGGVGVVARLGEALQAEGRLAVGELVAVYSGVSDLLDPEAGVDPMFTAFHIQGYQSPDGSHQQFLCAQGPQLLPPPADLSLETAASYLLPAGTAYRAIFTALGARPGKRLLVEGAAGGTGAWAVEIGRAAGLEPVGLVSSQARKQAVEAAGASAVDRKAPELAACFRPVPADPAKWRPWAEEGEAFLAAVREAAGGRLVDYAVSHAGERAFPRSFQALAEGGAITFYGASSGYRMTFLGKPGRAEPADMLARAELRPGEAAVILYGARSEGRDDEAIAAIEAARRAGARIVAVTDDDAERDFVLSLGFGDAVVGAVSLAELGRRVPQFAWPEGLPPLPDPQAETAAFKEAMRAFTETAFKPLGQAVGRLLRSADNPRGVPDVVVERARVDSLAVSTMLVKPHTGRVVYCGDMGGRRYSFYAPQVWMRQRRILMPAAAIVGTHLSNAAEIAALNRLIDSGAVRVPEPYLGAWAELPALHQAMWENHLPEATGGRAKAVVNHALPEPGLKTRDELLAAWADAAAESAPES